MQLLHLFESAATTPAQFFIASLWQGLLLAGAAWLGLEAWPAIARHTAPGRASKIAPRTRFLLWMIVLVLSVVLPFSTLMPTLMHGHAIQGPLAPVSALPAPQLSAVWAVVILAAWGLASLFCLARLLVNGWRLRALARNATFFPSDALAPELLAQLSTGASRRVELRLSSEIDGPIAVGFFRPSIVIPDWLSRKLTSAELNQIVIHELAHLRRKDDWTNLLQKFLRALFPLNPALLWVERRLCREREMACDDAVLAGSITPREYASCLTTLAEKRLLRNMQALAPGAWQRRSELAERVHRILRHKGALPPLRSRPLVGAFLLIYLCAGLALARCPRIIDFVSSGGVTPTLATSRGIAPPPGAGASFAGAHMVQATLRMATPINAGRSATGSSVAATQWTAPPRIEARSINAEFTGARSSQPRLLNARFAQKRRPSAGKQLGETQIIFTVWEILPSDLPALLNGDPAPSQFVALSPSAGWIVFQL